MNKNLGFVNKSKLATPSDRFDMLKRGALLFLHGSGGTGSELQGYLESIPLKDFGFETFGDILRAWNVTLYNPTSRVRRYTPLGGQKLNVWYDRDANFMTEGMNTAEDTDGIDQSIADLKKYISDIEQRSPFDYLILGGFSMGGGLSLHAFRHLIHDKLVAVFAMGSFASDPSALYRSPLSVHKSLPLLMMHGKVAVGVFPVMISLMLWFFMFSM